MTVSSAGSRRRSAKLRPTGGGRPPRQAHPAVEILVSYAARELARRRSRSVQDHLVRCAECAALVVDFVGFEALEPPTPAHRVSPRELGRSRRELVGRLAAAAR